ncbi:MAG: hypothetical protein ABGX16_09680 [Pirellulales bacterium]
MKTSSLLTFLFLGFLSITSMVSSQERKVGDDTNYADNNIAQLGEEEAAALVPDQA